MNAFLITVLTCSPYLNTNRLGEQHCVDIECPQNVEWIDAAKVRSDWILLVGITPPEISTDGVTGRQVVVYSIDNGQTATLRSASARLSWIGREKIRAIRSCPSGDLWILVEGSSINSEMVGYCNSESAEIKFNELPHPPTGFVRLSGVLSAMPQQGFRAAFMLRPWNDEEKPVPISVLMSTTFDLEEITSPDGIATLVTVHKGVRGRLTRSNDGIYVSQISDGFVTISSCVGEIRELVRFESTVQHVHYIFVCDDRVTAIIGTDHRDFKKKVFEAVPNETHSPIRTGSVLPSLAGIVLPHRCFLDTDGRVLVGTVADANIQVYELSFEPSLSARLLTLRDKVPDESFVSDLLLFKVKGVPMMIWTEGSRDPHFSDSDTIEVPHE